MFAFLPDIGQEAVPFLIFLSCVVFGILVASVVFSRLIKMATNVSGKYQEVVAEALSGMPTIWGILIGSYGSIHLMRVNEYWLQILQSLLVFLGLVSATLIVARLISGAVRLHASTAEGVLASASILASVTEVIVYLTGILIILQTFGISITPILTALGVGGLAVALALQDTLSNLFSGLHILISRQMKVGDYIKLSTGEEGNILDITWRNTTIKALANNIIVVPNHKIASAIVTNYYIPDKEVSVGVSGGVSYDSDLEFVEKVAIEVGRETMRDIEGGVPEFEPVVRFHTFGDFSINFNVILRAREFIYQFKVKHEFIKRLHKRFQLEGIEIYPIRNVQVRESSKPKL